MKKILVTGADGFIGSHLVEKLLKNKDYQVTALAQYNSFNNWGWLEQFYKKYSNLKIVTGDIRDKNLCEDISKNQDKVFNLAALIAIPYSKIAFESYLNTNIIGTFNILNAAKKNKVKKVIHLSTSEVYGTQKYLPIDENHPLDPKSPYAATKIAADAIAKSFFNSYDLKIIIARPFNTYGPRQSARAIIPTIISQILKKKHSIKLGNLEPLRDFTYVEDTCDALIKLSKSKINGEVVNIGCNKSISIKELFHLIKELMNSNIKLNIDTQRKRKKNFEVHHLKCNNKKLIKVTKFKPKHNLKLGLKKTIEWFRVKENIKFYKGEIYNI